MKLTLSTRAGKKKSELTKLRSCKDIPAVIYVTGSPSELVTVKGVEFEAILRGMPKGYLPTAIFELELDGKKIKAIVKDIQYNPTTYQVVHLDFLTLKDDTLVDINVPIHCLGEADCIGIKLGGFLRYVKRHIKVRCLPKNIPSDFKVDIRNLGITQYKRVKDIAIGNEIRPLIGENDVIVVIAKR